MLHRTFWTGRRLTGMTLILGCFLFLGAAGVMPRDSQGNFLVNLPLREGLLVIAAQPSFFQWSFSLFIIGTIVTLLGLAMLTRLLRDAGDTIISLLALIASLFGAVLMVIYCALFLGISPLAAQETVRTGMVPAYYVPFTLTIQPLFVIYTILSFSALIAYGGAVLLTYMLPHWVGWLAIAYGLAGLILAGLSAGNVPPFTNYLIPIVIGILLLLHRSKLPARNHSKEASTDISSMAVTGGRQ